MACLFHDFLVLQMDETVDADGSVCLGPRVLWRMPTAAGHEPTSEREIGQFCFPYPELLRKRTARSSPRADEFVFVLSKAGEGSDESAVHRTFGFVRRALGPGPRGRLDCGARYPECFCLVTSRPLFSLFPSFLKMAHGIRLLDDAALPDFVARISAPQPIPLRGETFRVRAPFPSPGHCTPPPDLRFAMPAGSSSHMFSDVSRAVLLHALGPRCYLLLLTALLSERRVLMVAWSLRKLTACVHAALAALHPLQWQHIFVPVLPSKLLSYACAPYPFLIGLHRSHLPDLLDPDSELALSEVLVVDLDASELHVAGNVRDDSPPLLRDIVGGGLMAPPRVLRRGADSIDGLRVRAAKYLATKLETYTPADMASGMETFSERSADAGQSLAERLHAIAFQHTGKTAAWRMANAKENDRAVDDERAEAPPTWDSTGSYGGDFVSPKTPSIGKAVSSSLYGLSPDDHALSEALLTFFLQLLGNPQPFSQSAVDGPASATAMDDVRERYFLSRGSSTQQRILDAGDSPPLTAFLAEFAHTQMFQVFSTSRDAFGRPRSPEEANSPFYVCAATMVQLGQSFDRKSVRKAVQRFTDSSTAVSANNVRYHPIALALTSNTVFQGDAAAAIEKLCRLEARDAMTLSRVVRTVEDRLGDCSGLRWRHGSKALALLKALLILGPEAVLVDALDLLGVVKTLTRFKSGLPPGAGSGSGELVRLAARDCLPLLLDVRRLILERARAAPPANAHRACLHRHPTRKVPWPPPSFAVLHSSLQPLSSMTSSFQEGAGSPLSPLLDFGAFDHDAFGSMDSAAISPDLHTSNIQSVDSAKDPFSDPWYTSVNSAASEQTSEWNVDWFHEGGTSSAPSNGTFGGSLEAGTPRVFNEDPFTPHPTPNKRTTASVSTSTGKVDASSHAKNDKPSASVPTPSENAYASSHSNNDKPSASIHTTIVIANASSQSDNEKSSALIPTSTEEANASSQARNVKPSTSVSTSTEKVNASPHVRNGKPSASVPNSTEKANNVSHAKNGKSSASDSTSMEKANVSPQARNDKPSTSVSTSTEKDNVSSHARKEMPSASECTSTEKVNARNELPSASVLTSTKANASPQAKNDKPSASESTPTGKADASSHASNDKPSISVSTSTEKANASPQAKNDKLSASESTCTEKVIASPHAPSSGPSRKQLISKEDPFASLHAVSGGSLSATYETSWDSFAPASLSNENSVTSPSEYTCRLPSADQRDPFAPPVPRADDQRDPFAPPIPRADDRRDPFAPPFPADDQQDPFAHPVSHANDERDPFAPLVSHADDQRDPFAPPSLTDDRRDPFAPPSPAGDKRDPFAPPSPTDERRDPLVPPSVTNSNSSFSGASAHTTSMSSAMWDLLRSDPLGTPESSKKDVYRR